MGEARRRNQQGLPPRPPHAKSSKANNADSAPPLASWLPLNRQQADQFVTITTKGAWVGIAALVIFWLTVRFIGPAAGWWTLADG